MNHQELARRGFPNIPEDLKLVVRHTRSDDGSGATQAVFSRDGQTPLAVGLAYCHPKDQFVRHVGWMKAVGRAYGELKRQGFVP